MRESNGDPEQLGIFMGYKKVWVTMKDPAGVD